MTMTVAVEVWIRPDDSVAGTRWTRWTPPSNLSRLYAPSPGISTIASLIPPIPVSLSDQDLGRELVRVGVAEVHPQELVGEQRGLLAAGAGPDLEDHVAVVVGVARQQQHLELLEQPRLVGLEPVDLVARHRRASRRRRRSIAQLARAGQLGADGLEAPEGLDHRLQAGQLLAEPADLGGVRRDLGSAEVGLDLVVLTRHLGQLGVELAHDPDGGSPGVAPAGSAGWAETHRLALERRSSRPGRPRRRPRAPAPSTRSRPRSCRRSAASS